MPVIPEVKGVYMSDQTAKTTVGHLTFKKAFGIDSARADDFAWIMELSHSSHQVDSWKIEIGNVGLTLKEKLAIGLFKNFDERDPDDIKPIPTINISTSLETDFPTDIDDSRIDSANSLVVPYVTNAFVALQKFIEAFRDAKYLMLRNTPRWESEQGVYVKEMSFLTFNTLLFYSVIASEKEYVGHFSQGVSRSISPDDPALKSHLEKNLTKRVPLERVLMVRAWEALFEGDFRSAIVDSATIIEGCIIKIVKNKLTEKNAASARAISKFIKETSKRHLLRIVGSLTAIESSEWREKVINDLETRHALVHGEKRYATYAEAKSAVTDAQRFLEIMEKLKTAGAPDEQ